MIVTKKKTLNIPFLLRFMEYSEFLYFDLTNVFYLTYRALNVLSEECDLIQSELYRNSKSVLKRNYKIISSTIHFPKLHRIPPSKGFAQYYLFFPSRISTMVFSVPVIPGDAISPILCMVSSGVAPLIPWAL